MYAGYAYKHSTYFLDENLVLLKLMERLNECIYVCVYNPGTVRDAHSSACPTHLLLLTYAKLRCDGETAWEVKLPMQPLLNTLEKEGS